ncbi:MAG: hypothetical protein WCK70_01000 [Chloroflexales bacterium]
MSTTATNITVRTSRWLTALIGALCITALSMITTLDGGIAPPTPTDMPITLAGITTIEQTFTITRPDLVGLAIQIHPATQIVPDLRIPLHLRYADGPPIDLVSENLSVQAATNGVIAIRFPPLMAVHDLRVPTTTLTFILDIPQVQPNTGLTFTARENHQTPDTLTIDGRVLTNRELVFAPIYQHRWADSLWPISAMARGKPGVLGWPPLYALLAYIYLIVLGVGIANLRRIFLSQG